ncbi:hypothetical protein [Marinibactrum halimedae]|nr:hypothetical protein [Marinibactrum halimedae]MCD9458095.1 hypothetical protein [Marinibactrum halimedae]
MITTGSLRANEASQETLLSLNEGQLLTEAMDKKDRNIIIGPWGDRIEQVWVSTVGSDRKRYEGWVDAKEIEVHSVVKDKKISEIRELKDDYFARRSELDQAEGDPRRVKLTALVRVLLERQAYSKNNCKGERESMVCDFLLRRGGANAIVRSVSFVEVGEKNEEMGVPDHVGAKPRKNSKSLRLAYEDSAKILSSIGVRDTAMGRLLAEWIAILEVERSV